MEGIALRREEQRRAGGILAAVSDAGEGTAGDGQISAVGGQIHPVELAAGDGDMAAQHQNGAVPPQLTATLTVADGKAAIDHQIVGAGETLAVEIQRIGAGGEAHAAPEGIPQQGDGGALQRCGILGSVLKDGEVAEGIILSHLGHHLGAADAAGDAVDLIVGAGDHGDIFQRGRDVTAADQLAVRLLIGSAEGQSRTGICGILRRNAGEGAAEEGHGVGLKVQRVFKAAGLHRQAAALYRQCLTGDLAGAGAVTDGEAAGALLQRHGSRQGQGVALQRQHGSYAVQREGTGRQRDIGQHDH